MNLPRFACMIAALASLAGCQTITPEQLRAADEAQCRSYGFKAGTDAFAGCLQRIDLARDADRRAQLRALDDPLVVYQPVYVVR
ncbi:hypothetical protein [Aureimonas frigidaquae]|uniref:Lipoprotein n=1 Tax=Aureimonas frigidaquae TaxID=424757 RepID=A0A0P0Z256_9HYPH|nr:hypothetical protein [Aureimonas frigidaquae]BAT28154.1 lipoprotein [Aureimonas frigidaquae]